MRRAFIVIAVIGSLCFQGVALARQVLAWDHGGDAAHSVLHAGGVAHHHHEDGSVHRDTSQKSKQHVQNDGCASVAMIPAPDASGVGAWAASGGGADSPSEGYDSPFLEGLKRPPR
jgi:hypothetical protein